MSTKHEDDAPAGDVAERTLEPADITFLFPPDPELIVSPEGDTRGLREAQDEARTRAAG